MPRCGSACRVGRTARQAARWEGDQSSVGEVGIGIDIDVGVEAIVWFDVVLELGVRIEGVTVEVELQLRRRSGRRAPGPVGGQAEVPQDLRVRLRDRRRRMG